MAAWLVVYRPHAPRPTPKGEAARAAAVQIGCGSSGGHVCRAGETLMFSVNSAVVSGYLAAYAEGVHDPTHQRIWYFPTFDGRAPLVSPGPGTTVLADGIQIGREHPPGRYRVTVWLSERPEARDQIEVGNVGASRDESIFDLEVVP